MKLGDRQITASFAEQQKSTFKSRLPEKEKIEDPETYMSTTVHGSKYFANKIKVTIDFFRNDIKDFRR